MGAVTTEDQFEKQFAKLYAYMDGHFKQIDARFEQVDKRFEQSDQQFTSLYVYMNDRFDAIETELAKKADKDDMYQRFDAIAEHLDAQDVEMAAIKSQLNRHEGWIHQLSEHAELRLVEDGWA
ncbi:hypothetical protein [Mycobacteroides abscessus]|uniref:hypothetical protein n=1 Tax=Mycobacteroides abscessus TaxID=36809 RepID=UPI000385C944|nr:hypothetical protein [Mycobacteroides abscessus]EPZ18431.1 hypothetical protein M879_21695 [Mycobacteroides abscessus V06705]MBN7551375.1 hypothetical protein [Mycobacteroides abscessus subsp. abscessus]MDM2692221.1 hypothetical protein [Mycobacteroides abscessus]MDM2697033.1 hypothetical protein [Mycobacteroides abscessus]MDM2702242.1 hypothetical protein [Mycobacteroides abscessus]